jgi:hypothetical protein
MSDYETVNDICRQRRRTKGARIIGDTIIGTGDELPPATEASRKPKFIAQLDCVTSHEWEDFVRLKVRIDRKTFAALRDLAGADNRSVESLLRRSLIRTAKVLARKANDDH